jgi:mRNA-degrading endonuclease YafQ of YafQ-DinJ toxin-antitoxin module
MKQLKELIKKKESIKFKSVLKCKLNNKPCVYRNQPDTGAYEDCRQCYVYEQYTIMQDSLM